MSNCKGGEHDFQTRYSDAGKPIGAIGEESAHCYGRTDAAADQFRSFDASGVYRNGPGGSLLCLFKTVSTGIDRGRGLSRTELARGQPGWNTRSGSEPATATLWILCRSCRRCVRRIVSDRRPWPFRIYDGDDGVDADHCLFPAVDRTVSRHICGRNFSIVLWNFRANRASDRRGTRNTLPAEETGSEY